MNQHFSISFLIFAVIAVFAQSGVVQTVVGNDILTNGGCIYVDGEISENGVSRSATQDEIDQVTVYQKGMADWGTAFIQWMTEKMSNMFNKNYVPPPQPVTPKVPCLCSPQYCSGFH